MDRHPSPGAPHSFPRFHPHITLASISSSSTRVAAPPTATAPPTAAAGQDAPSHGTAPSTHRDDSGPDPDPVVLLTLREAAPLGQRAIRVRFARVLAGDHYFRSIYVAIAPSPELAQLRAAFALAKAQVQVQAQAQGGQQKRGAPGIGPDDPPAFPHLSLYYVADEEAHARARVLQELEREDVVRHSADGLSVALRCAGEGGGGGGGGHGGGEGDGVLEGLTCTQIWIVDCGGPVEGWKVLDKILLAK